MYKSFVKRLFDIGISVVMVLLLFPLMCCIALAVWFDVGSPVLFKQVRAGYHEQPFVMYKFRTMTNERTADGGLLPDSHRITRLGRFLRATSLDELPELFNVLRGEMSLVGPRPLLMRYLPYYTEEERARFSVRPGITGLAQISGRNDLPWTERLAIDAYYARNCSLLLDLRIILVTVVNVMLRQGVRVDPSVTMDDLDVERSRTRREAASG
jgi:undecaprenyl phosphate N,N'-diacetylbacillosamine 1-phosphate transferase